MDLAALNNIEKRIIRLESKITFKTPLEDVNVKKVKSVIDALHEVDTVLISTLCGREKITSLLERINILEKILDPSYLETSCNSDLKVSSILESESQLIDFNDNMARVEQLEPALNTKIDKETVNTDRMNKLLSSLSTSKEECKQQSIEVQDLVTKYRESIAGLNNLFVDLEASITQLETELQPK